MQFSGYSIPGSRLPAFFAESVIPESENRLFLNGRSSDMF